MKGGDNPRPNVHVVTETEATAVVDGDHGLGQVVSKRAMEIAIAKARGAGVGLVGARNTHHFGASAYWAQMALPHDMIGIVTTNGGPIMAPWGGLTRSLCNDAFGVAVPAGEEWPIVLDMATSVVAGGKLDVAIRKGERIPSGWALNLKGEPTNDPREARAGLLLPMAGYKGYGLTVVFEVLAAVLTGARFARYVQPRTPTEHREIGHFFEAIQVAAFMPVDSFKARVDDLIRQMRSSERAPGVERIFVPGEPEHENRARHLAEGIPMMTTVLEDLQALADRLGVGTDGQLDVD